MMSGPTLVAKWRAGIKEQGIFSSGVMVAEIKKVHAQWWRKLFRPAACGRGTIASETRNIIYETRSRTTNAKRGHHKRALAVNGTSDRSMTHPQDLHVVMQKKITAAKVGMCLLCN